MSLPKKEIAGWLSAEDHAKLKALADAKRVSMGQYAAHWVAVAVRQKFDEAVSILQAVKSSGMLTEKPASCRKAPEENIDSAFHGADIGDAL